MAGTAIFVLVVALATLVCASLPPPEPEVTEPISFREGPPYSILDFHVETEEYGSFFLRLRKIISKASPQEIQAHYVLPKQPSSLHQRPCRVVLLELTGRKGKWVYLYVRLDNLYVLGFINKYLKWNMFRDSKRIIPRSHGLTFGSGYSDILGTGGYKKLPGVEVGKAATLAAVEVLSEFRHHWHNDEAIKPALATMLVVFAEAARFRTIRETISNGWGQGTSTTISEQQAKYVVHWKDFSCALIYWNNKFHQQHWGFEGSATQALATVDTLLLGRECEEFVRDTRRGRWC